MSKVLPVAIQDRPELNLRQGIKSSLNGWRLLLASLYLFYLYKRDESGDTFCKEVSNGGGTSLSVGDEFSAWLNSKWSSIPDVVNKVANSPIYTAQMEPLQVGLELFLKLCKVSFVDSSRSDSSERTGGNRFAKKLMFSTNMKIFADAISMFPETDITGFLDKWLSNNDDTVISQRAKEILVTFTEECQYKIRANGTEVFFRQEGVYECLKDPTQSVESSDSHEQVGPFRILKSYVKDKMHPYLSDSSDGFLVNPSALAFPFYADLVQTTLSLIPKRTTIYQEVSASDTEQTPPKPLTAHQIIYYGAPGTGKSDRVQMDAGKRKDTVRTTFHPDSDYASFVGAYKPKMKPVQRINCIDDKAKSVTDIITGDPSLEEVIAYEFTPQAFTKAYVQAWEKMAKPSADGKIEKQFLVIEEINRGNCAQIFGDIFQLLDREEGYSRYPICADDDLERYLSEQFKDLAFDPLYEKVKLGKELVLPPNFYIYATMNTSDQSLFPMDSAFKRRWTWKYVPISEGVRRGATEKLEWEVDVVTTVSQSDGAPKISHVRYSWWGFLQKINEMIFDLTDSEDKMIGYFFVTPEDGKSISDEQFVNKVIFYLWNDVYKNYGIDNLFKGQDNGVTDEKNRMKGVPFTDFFDKNNCDKVNVSTLTNFFKKIKVDPIEHSESAWEKQESST